MIEADKMLQLRRYMILLRTGAKSRVARSHLHSSSLSSSSPNLARHEGYISRYVHHGLAQLQTRLRPCENYAATCIRTLSTTVPQSVDDIDHKLVSLCEDIKKGKVSADSLKEAIRLCDESDYQLHHDIGVLLLKSCGSPLSDLKPVERQYLTEQVWRLAQRNSEGLTLEYYNTLLQVHAENFSSVEPKKFLADMNVEPNENTYYLLLKSVARTRNDNHLQDIMSVIKEKNVTISEDMLNTLMQIYTTNGNIAQAEHVITLMQDAKLSTDKAYTELACGYAKLGDIPNLVKILNDEPQSDTNILRLIKVLSLSNNGRHIPVVLNFLTASVPAIKLQISKTIAELIRADRAVDAHTIINCFARNDMTKDVAKSFVNTFLNELVMLNASTDDITRYANDFIDSGCDPLALNYVAESSLKLGRENLCFAIFKAMREKGMEVRPHYYWPLLTIAYCNQGEPKILSLVKHMIDTGVEVDSDTLLHYIYPYVNTANPSNILQKLIIIGVSSYVAYTPLISFLLSQNRMQAIKSLYTYSKSHKVHYQDLIKPLVRAYADTKDIESSVLLLTLYPHGVDFVGLFMKILLNERRLTYPMEDLQLFLNEFKKRELKISQQDAIFLKKKLSDENLTIQTNDTSTLNLDDLVDNSMTESALSFPHSPKYMNTKQLACLLVELESRNFSTRTVLRRLLEAYCRENNLKKAEEIKQKLNAHHYQWSTGMKIYLFELYFKNNKLQEAETVLSELQTGNFRVDSTKIVMFATALVNAGKPKKAFEIIKNFKNINRRDTAQKQCALLLQALAQTQYYSYTKDMLKLLLEKQYCDINMEVLRPLVAIPLEHNDVLGAVDVFVTIAQRHKRAPLASELLTALLQQKSSSQSSDIDTCIEKVYDILTDIYTIEVANTHLAIALATANKIKELETVLQTQRLSMNALSSYFGYVQRTQNADNLLKLFKATPETSNIEQTVLSEMLLSAYDKIGDCNSAIELWKVMRAKNVKLSEQFKFNFIHFLRANKVPLPPEFEEADKVNVSNQ